MVDENTSGVSSYMDYVANAASFEAYKRDEENPLLSAETLSENASSLVDFASFARDYPEKLFPLLDQLRPEFREMFIECYMMHKPQWFIGKTHGCIQTRIWQALRIIEQNIGALIILGPEPPAMILRIILKKAEQETTEYGNLSDMIALYATSRSYAKVAEKVGAPVPAIRKIFRPAIAALLANKDVKAVAVGAYLRGLTHQASLTKTGLSKRALARTRRVKTMRFDAPPLEESPLISFGATVALQDKAWCMFEISSESRMAQIYPNLQTMGKRIFGKKPAQIFVPCNADGELTFGYLFARCTAPNLTKQLTRIRGISEMAAIYTDEGALDHAVTVPDADVQKMIAEHETPAKPKVHASDFVEILTGPAARYHGTVLDAGKKIIVQVEFPTSRHFIVSADASSVRLVAAPKGKRAFYGRSL